jgi:hypothetical protein
MPNKLNKGANKKSQILCIRALRFGKLMPYHDAAVGGVAAGGADALAQPLAGESQHAGERVQQLTSRGARGGWTLSVSLPLLASLINSG